MKSYRRDDDLPTGVSGPSLSRNTISECWSSIRNRGGRLFLASMQLTLLNIRHKVMTTISLKCRLSELDFNRTFLYALADCVWLLLTTSVNFIIVAESLLPFLNFTISRYSIFVVLRNDFSCDRVTYALHFHKRFISQGKIWNEIKKRQEAL